MTTNNSISVLLGSGGFATEGRKKDYRRFVGKHFEGCDEVLFVPYASDEHNSYTSRMQDFLGESGPLLRGIHEFDDPASALSEARGLYVGGGNSFLLIRDLHENELIEPIRERVFSGLPYLGVSAGANVASPTMKTTNDMPIALPPSFESFGIVPFQINPHYHPGKIMFQDGDEIANHFGESRAQRIAEYHRLDSTPVLGMWEGSFVQWDGSRGRLTGRATAFAADAEPIDMYDGSEFDTVLRVV